MQIKLLQFKVGLFLELDLWFFFIFIYAIIFTRSNYRDAVNYNSLIDVSVDLRFLV